MRPQKNSEIIWFVILTAFIPGLGHVCAGNFAKGLVMILILNPLVFLVSIFTFFLPMLVYVGWACNDCIKFLERKDAVRIQKF